MLNKTLNEAFSDTLPGEECSRKMLCTAIESLVDSYDVVFREILSNVPEKQKELLYAIIALDGNAMAITSAAFIRRHHLSSSSSVQAAARKLIEKELVSENNKVYSV